MVPDLDFLLISTRLEYLRDHRGWTHSFLVLPLLALAIALVAKAFWRKARVATLWLFAAIGVATHILFDWITSFGTMFWAPVSRTRHSLDWVFILDPFFTGIVLVSLVLSLIHRDRERRIAAVGAGLLCAYIAFCAVLHARALAIWKRMDAPPAGAEVAVLPQFLSPFRWLGLSEQGNEIHVVFFDIGPFARGSADPRPPKKWTEILGSLRDFYPPPGRATIRRFERPADSPVLAAARALPDIGVYRAFARFPLETIYPTADGGSEVIVQDLRFLPWFTGPWEPGGAEGLRRQPFVYRVRFDASLRAVERGFVRGGRR
jgi:inner membrane protein